MKVWRLVVVALVALATQAGVRADDPPALKDVADAGQGEQLRALVAAAAREGSLSYWDTVLQFETESALASAFRAYYGLPVGFKVNYSLASAADLVTRIDQELTSRRVTTDVAAIASLPWVHAKIKAGQIQQYASPQYRYYRGAFDKGLGRDGYFAFNGAYVFVPMWNANKLKLAGTSWKDLIGAVPAGRISMGDAGKSPTYLSTYIGLRTILGLDYFKRLAEMKPTFLVRSEQIANQVVTGQSLLTFSGMPTRAYQFNKRGAKLTFLLPKEGVVLLPQALFILAGAPHPSAAKLWIDFVLSEAGQKIIVENEALVSGRSGFTSPLPDYAPPLDRLTVIRVNWDQITTADMAKARAEWAALFNP